MQIDDAIPMRLRRAYLAIHRAAQSCFSHSDVTVDQYVLLSVLAEEDGLTQSQIGTRMSSDANTIGAMLRLLEQKQLVVREPCDSDKRARRVRLTPAGRRLQRKLVGIAEPLHQVMEDAIAPGDRAMLFDCLDRIARAVTAPAVPR